MLPFGTGFSTFEPFLNFFMTMDGIPSAEKQYPDAWGDGSMHTESIGQISTKNVIEGEVSPGEYPDRMITRDQELTILSGSVIVFQSGVQESVRFSKGEKFKLYEGRTYTFKFEERFVFSCQYC